MAITRCPWPKNELAVKYHDEEWGVPVHEDRVLFEFLILEGAQAGLSWDTILAKRARYREVYAGFDMAAVARFGEREKAALLADTGIVRNRLKVEASVINARAGLKVVEEFGSLDAYFWSFVDGRPVVTRRATLAEIPARTALSDAMSADLRKRGFKFVGTTICYAFMQATGLVDDHLASCFRSRAKPR
ncbi:MAG: DNA-3-methyladenine glycosylase I [Phycisphaerales bacterium]|nr:DNA-3-methyladenine glycosylase I [Phycisphaerales bacterium]